MHTNAELDSARGAESPPSTPERVHQISWLRNLPLCIEPTTAFCHRPITTPQPRGHYPTPNLTRKEPWIVPMHNVRESSNSSAGKSPAFPRDPFSISFLSGVRRRIIPGIQDIKRLREGYEITFPPLETKGSIYRDCLPFFCIYRIFFFGFTMWQWFSIII